MKSKQLSFDDIISNRIEIGDSVEIIARPESYHDIEDYYYLQEYTDKKGKVVRITKGRRSVSFEIEFKDGSIGMFYEHEIQKIGGSSL